MSRFILANTEELHERIEELQERITQLEVGLQSLYRQTCSGESNEPHPLLTDDLLNIKTPMGAEIVGSANPRLRRHTHSPETSIAGAGIGEGDPGDELTDSFGTLALGDDSTKSVFFGAAAGAQFLLGVSHVLYPLPPLFSCLYAQSGPGLGRRPKTKHGGRRPSLEQ